MDKLTNKIIRVDGRQQFHAISLSDIIATLRSVAIHSLTRMYRPEEHLFAFRLRKNSKGEVLEGVSRRYTAIALIGLAGEDQHVVSEVIGNHSCKEVCGKLIDRIGESQELGEIALTTWAARALQHSYASRAIDRLRQIQPGKVTTPTIELSWALTALVIDGSEAIDMTLAKRVADALMGSFREESSVFAHGPKRKGLAAFGAHVSCFADFVYPIQALSYYYQVTKDEKAAEIACRCAEQMCHLQGPQGQWWWHFDVRTGRVIERYPVYSVHQDSMAPMALFSLSRICGQDYSRSIERGLRWLIKPLEVTGCLVDIERNIIWRSATRPDPIRLVLRLAAAASRLHPTIRIPAVDSVFPPNTIDYESRPYHMGWILHAWPASHTADFVAGPGNFKCETSDQQE